MGPRGSERRPVAAQLPGNCNTDSHCNRNGDTHSYGYSYGDSNSNGYGNSDAYSHGNRNSYGYANRHTYRNSNCNTYCDCYGHSDGNANCHAHCDSDTSPGSDNQAGDQRRKCFRYAQWLSQSAWLDHDCLFPVGHDNQLRAHYLNSD